MISTRGSLALSPCSTVKYHIVARVIAVNTVLVGMVQARVAKKLFNVTF